MLLLRCLRSDITQRCHRFEKVLAHQFFSAAQEKGLGTEEAAADTSASHVAERDKQATETWPAHIQKKSSDLHSAIARRDPKRVKTLFAEGTVHMATVDEWPPASVPVQPLHRAAFAGHVETVEILLQQIESTLKSSVNERKKVLDHRTRVGYTPLMIARACGHEGVAQLLRKAGCTEDLTNSMDQTAQQLHKIYEHEKLQQQLSPWRHGHQLRQSTNGLEQYLAHVDKMARLDSFKYGIRVWHSKFLVAHLRGRHESDLDDMNCLLNDVRSRLPKSKDLALHFTDLETARHVCLESPGLRASACGQLGGGLSVSLKLLDDFEWAQGGSFGGTAENFQFAMKVAGRLWGKKWYEVMPGPRPDKAELAQKLIELPAHDFKAQKLTPTELAAALGNGWGKHASKLEAAFLVRVPSKTKRDTARIVPGRSDVYIIPQTDCVDDGLSDYRYYSTAHIEALFILQVPGDIGDAQLQFPQLRELSDKDELQRLQVTVRQHARRSDGAPDAGIGHIELPADDHCISDDVQDRRNEQDLRKILFSYTAFVGSSHNVGSVLQRHHDASVERQVLWSESVARYTREEMKAGINGVEELMPQSHTMAFYYTTKAKAERMCIERQCVGGIQPDTPYVVNEASVADYYRIGEIQQSRRYHGIKVCLERPEKLGWRENAGGEFKSNVHKRMGLAQEDVQVMMVLQVRACLLNINLAARFVNLTCTTLCRCQQK
eukprot:COSAG01_NODE_1574_length_9861_cov_8.255071_1_plen_719_part_00